MAPNADPEDVSREDVVRERLARQFGADCELEIVWVGPYAYRSECIDRMRHGRVFFMGDAAKVVSPFGARGGNTGVVGRRQPGLEAGRGDEGHGGAGAAGQLPRRAPRRRPAERQGHQPHGALPAAGRRHGKAVSRCHDRPGPAACLRTAIGQHRPHGDRQPLHPLQRVRFDRRPAGAERELPLGRRQPRAASTTCCSGPTAGCCCCSSARPGRRRSSGCAR